MPSPEAVGFTTKAGLLAAAKRSPHLRPCPKHRGTFGTWNWVYVTLCDRCKNKIEDGM
ncbi:MAG: hypothetical protein R3Y11_09600 [Pseudomonadota bacterium]